MLRNFKFKKTLRLIGFEIGITVLLCTSCLYFSLIALNGKHGVKKKIELEFETMQLNDKLTELENVALNLERKTLKLKGEDLDLDLLDQQAREILGLIHEDEMIITKQP